MTERQLTGSVLLMLIALLISYLCTPGVLERAGIKTIPYAEPAAGKVVVELDGNAINNGVYFLAEGSSVADVLTASGQHDFSSVDRRILNTRLSSGDRISVRLAEGQPADLSVNQIKNNKRLALDMPVDINTSTVDDLMLIPGIGEKTAEKIVSYRTGIGKFRRLEDLKKVKGIKEKRYKKLAKYFYLGKDKI